MRDARLHEDCTVRLEAKTCVKRHGLNLRVHANSAQPEFMGMMKYAPEQGRANTPAAPLGQDSHAADPAIRAKARDPDEGFTGTGHKPVALAVCGLPFELFRHALLLNEDTAANVSYGLGMSRPSGPAHFEVRIFSAHHRMQVKMSDSIY